MGKAIDSRTRGPRESGAQWLVRLRSIGATFTPDEALVLAYRALLPGSGLAASLADGDQLEVLRNGYYEVVDELTGRERRILTMKLGLEDGRLWSQDEIADAFGITRAEVAETERTLSFDLRSDALRAPLHRAWSEAACMGDRRRPSRLPSAADDNGAGLLIHWRASEIPMDLHDATLLTYYMTLDGRNGRLPRTWPILDSDALLVLHTGLDRSIRDRLTDRQRRTLYLHMGLEDGRIRLHTDLADEFGTRAERELENIQDARWALRRLWSFMEGAWEDAGLPRVLAAST